MPRIAMHSMKPRPGITLLEVLIASFVVAIGLLSLATLLPVGKKLLSDAGRNDRAVSTGLTGVADVAARQISDAGSWYPAYTDTASTAPGSGWSVNQTVCIDPRGYNLGLGAFPDTTIATTTAAVPRMPRLSLDAPGAAYAPISVPLADRLFTFQDDSLFSTITTGEDRPRRAAVARGADGVWGSAGDDDGNGTVDDETEAAWPGSDDVTTVQGDYSWMATLTPQYHVSQTSPAIRGYNMGTPIYDTYGVYRPTGNYTLDVVVFQKRTMVDDGLKPARERVCYADLMDKQGKFVRLRSDNVFPGTADERFFKVKSGQWLLLAANREAVTMPDGSTVTAPPYFGWFRVVGRGEVRENPAGTTSYAADLMLAGPDLDHDNYATNVVGGSVIKTPVAATFIDADGANATGVQGMTMFAIILDDVIGVFQKTITREQATLWAQ